MKLIQTLTVTSRILWAAAAAAIPTWLEAAPTEILLPLQRTAYQTNEWIDVAVDRSSPARLPCGSPGRRGDRE